ncbi:EF-P 5-aminopentanol modification-associated protein YfmH [Geomicrobium sp. JCM 19038]|uniref:EF-P 5-aminopentanol modification-associated protein YfmH n=1 Tax=Geomicrobium sp. JCM 19038 TaxID=1460635 RepID=UPI00045F2E30|nr:pitrilysin family protein [Geomicrobium sp. JCM 19038]GAK07584.1 peptidase [Geomicrobium sp. JCM 19038]
MEKLHYDQLGETLYKETLDNGLKVYILPRQENNKTFSIFTTNYGSIDDQFTPMNEDEVVNVPDGIAHFLEHKLFEDEEGDVFDTFSRRGAQTNAFTSFTRTAYLFSSTSGVKDNVKTLIDFVQKPYFTKESVAKEQGIIEQEIRMYEDDADWRLFFGLIAALYEKSTVRVDIAGTVSSIQDITKDMLYQCYETFYHPSNMVLFIVGPVDPDEMLTLVKENQAGKTFKEQGEITRIYGDEPETSYKKEDTLHMNVQTPKVLLGFKEANDEYPLEGLSYELAMQMLLDIMFGPSSEAYEEMYREGIIDSSFSTDFTMERSFGFSAIGGDTKDPDALVKKVRETIRSYKQKALSEEEMAITKKRKIGSFLKQLNSSEFIATQFTRYEMNNDDLFEVVPKLEALTLDDLEKVLQRHFVDDHSSIMKVLPK